MCTVKKSNIIASALLFFISILYSSFLYAGDFNVENKKEAENLVIEKSFFSSKPNNKTYQVVLFMRNGGSDTVSLDKDKFVFILKQDENNHDLQIKKVKYSDECSNGKITGACKVTITGVDTVASELNGVTEYSFEFPYEIVNRNEYHSKKIAGSVPELEITNSDIIPYGQEGVSIVTIKNTSRDNITIEKVSSSNKINIVDNDTQKEFEPNESQDIKFKIIDPFENETKNMEYITIKYLSKTPQGDTPKDISFIIWYDVKTSSYYFITGAIVGGTTMFVVAIPGVRNFLFRPQPQPHGGTAQQGGTATQESKPLPTPQKALTLGLDESSLEKLNHPLAGHLIPEILGVFGSRSTASIVPSTPTTSTNEQNATSITTTTIDALTNDPAPIDELNLADAVFTADTVNFLVQVTLQDLQNNITGNIDVQTVTYNLQNTDDTNFREGIQHDLRLVREERLHSHHIVAIPLMVQGAQYNHWVAMVMRLDPQEPRTLQIFYNDPMGLTIEEGEHGGEVLQVLISAMEDTGLDTLNIIDIQLQQQSEYHYYDSGPFVVDNLCRIIDAIKKKGLINGAEDFLKVTLQICNAQSAFKLRLKYQAIYNSYLKPSPAEIVTGNRIFDEERCEEKGFENYDDNILLRDVLPAKVTCWNLVINEPEKRGAFSKLIKIFKKNKPKKVTYINPNGASSSSTETPTTTTTTTNIPTTDATVSTRTKAHSVHKSDDEHPNGASSSSTTNDSIIGVTVPIPTPVAQPQTKKLTHLNRHRDRPPILNRKASH